MPVLNGEGVNGKAPSITRVIRVCRSLSGLVNICVTQLTTFNSTRLDSRRRFFSINNFTSLTADLRSRSSGEGERERETKACSLAIIFGGRISPPLEDSTLCPRKLFLPIICQLCNLFTKHHHFIYSSSIINQIILEMALEIIVQMVLKRNFVDRIFLT